MRLPKKKNTHTHTHTHTHCRLIMFWWSIIVIIYVGGFLLGGLGQGKRKGFIYRHKLHRMDHDALALGSKTTISFRFTKQWSHLLDHLAKVLIPKSFQQRSCLGSEKGGGLLLGVDEARGMGVGLGEELGDGIRNPWWTELGIEIPLSQWGIEWRMESSFCLGRKLF